MAGERSLPAGHVTFVFTDIEGSTRLLKRLPDRYPDLLERHQHLLNEAWQAHGGEVVSAEGDAVLVAFSDPGAAVVACARAQRLLATEPWPDDGVVRVRMGVHGGIAWPRSGTYAALAVNQAARVVAAAHGGQVLVSEVVAERAELPAEVGLEPLGRYRLRDFDEPALLLQVVTPETGATSMGVRATPAEGHNLVRPPTSFLGRGLDLAQLTGVVGPQRLVTLVGPGGVGKTRLATELGIRQAPEWSDGVWLVDIAEDDDDDLLVDRVADVLRAAVTDDRRRDLLDHLRQRAMLLILDNAEARLDACVHLVRDVLASCDAGVLVTSREPLRVPGEMLVRLAPLPMRDDGEAADDDPALSLFVDRARAVRPQLQWDDGELDVARRIVRRLDGLPLAIEIAAARVDVLSLPEILGGLDQGARLLSSRDRSIPARQRSMQALLDWSYRSLHDDERAVLRRLSVFGAGFSMKAAEMAAAADDLDPDDVAEVVWSLVDKSLLVADLTANATRYRCFETVRGYARALLDAEGATPSVGLQLGRWYVERLGPDRPADRAWMGDVAMEVGNLRTLVPIVSSRDPAVAQGLAYTIGRYHDVVCNYRTGIDELGRYVDELTAPTASRVGLLTRLCDLHLRVGEVDAARRVLAEAEALARDVGPPPWDDAALARTAGEIANRSHDPATAITIAERALDGDLSTWGRARIANLLGIARYSTGDVAGAAGAFRVELESWQELGQEVYAAAAHGNVAEMELLLGDVVSAARHQHETLRLSQALGLPVLAAFSLIVAGRLAAQLELWETATALVSNANECLERTGVRLYEDDQRSVDDLLAAARRALGDLPFDAALARGRAFDALGAGDKAAEVLSTVAARDGP